VDLFDVDRSSNLFFGGDLGVEGVSEDKVDGTDGGIKSSVFGGYTNDVVSGYRGGVEAIKVENILFVYVFNDFANSRAEGCCSAGGKEEDFVVEL